jgi:hypothetical protein
VRGQTSLAVRQRPQTSGFLYLYLDCSGVLALD